MADAVPVGCQPGGILIMMRAIQDINSLTWQGVGWRVREWRLNGEIVAHEETATAHSSSTAVCPTETSSVAGLHLCSPARIIEIIERNKMDLFREVKLTRESRASSSPRILRRMYLSGMRPSFPPTFPRHQSEDTWTFLVS